MWKKTTEEYTYYLEVTADNAKFIIKVDNLDGRVLLTWDGVSWGNISSNLDLYTKHLYMCDSKLIKFNRILEIIYEDYLD